MSVQKILPVFKKGRFYAAIGAQSRMVLLPSLAWYVQSWLKRQIDQRRLPVQQVVQFKPLAPGRCRIVWLGHATFLLQFGVADRAPICVLTDPIFDQATILFKRACPVGIAPEQLPTIDYVLLSHNHRDHWDESSIRRIVVRNPSVKFLVPLGDAAWFAQHGITAVRELTWWESVADVGITFTFLPAYHWSGRGLTDYNRSLWGSFLIQAAGHTIFFGGDTAYGNHFANIAHHTPAIDIALLPIGPCDPGQYMRSSHISQEWVVRAFLELGAKTLIPMHWGTFFFGVDMVYTPLHRLKAAWQVYAEQVREQILQDVYPGQVLEYESHAGISVAEQRLIITD